MNTSVPGEAPPPHHVETAWPMSPIASSKPAMKANTGPTKVSNAKWKGKTPKKKNKTSKKKVAPEAKKSKRCRHDLKCRDWTCPYQHPQRERLELMESMGGYAVLHANGLGGCMPILQRHIFSQQQYAYAMTQNQAHAVYEDPLVGREGVAGVAIVIHGGVNTRSREEMTAAEQGTYHGILSMALRIGHEVLTSGGTSRGAVVAAISILERAATFGTDRKVEIVREASIIEGRDFKAGAVAQVQRVACPIHAADALLENNRNSLLVGRDAEAFVAMNGTEANDDGVDGDVHGGSDGGTSFGTVGAVAIDSRGDIVAGASAGGYTTGNAAILGTSTYADNRVCGVSSMCHEEHSLRPAVAHDVCARVRYKRIGLQEAVTETVAETLGQVPGGIIAIDRDANVAVGYNGPGLFRAWVEKDGRVCVDMF